MSHFFTCDSIAIDFGIDYSSFSSKALRPFHITEDTKLFIVSPHRGYYRLIFTIHLKETMGLDKLIFMSEMQAFVVVSGKSVCL